jgi:hypothetical protein
MAKYYYIAKEKFGLINLVSNKITREEWEQGVNSSDQLTWYDDTDDGKKDLKLLNIEPRIWAVSDFDSKKKYWKLNIKYIPNYGVVGIDVDKVTYGRLLVMLQLSQKLNALLLVNGRKVVDHQYIEKYRRPGT